MILGLDTSHYQGSPNWTQVKASGRDFVVIKATEGTTYIDPGFAANRAAAHAAGLIVGFYHFARGGSAAAEAAWFVRTIGALQPGEFLVLDWEITYAGDHVAWCKAWLDAVTAATGVAPLIYMNQSAMNAHNWMPLSGAHGLWLAKYDGSTAAPTACNCWPSAAMKQYSSTAAVPGVAGSCDVNAFYGTAAQLLAYGKGGTPAPAPPTVQQEDDMRLIRTPDGTIWTVTDTEVTGLTSLAAANALAKIWGPWQNVEFAEKDAMYLDADARVKRQMAKVQSYVLGADPGPDPKQWLFPRIVDIDSKVGQAQAPTLDETKLAAALLADPTFVDRMGAAIAAHLKLTSS